MPVVYVIVYIIVVLQVASPRNLLTKGLDCSRLKIYEIVSKQQLTHFYHLKSFAGETLNRLG